MARYQSLSGRIVANTLVPRHPPGRAQADSI